MRRIPAEASPQSYCRSFQVKSTQLLNQFFFGFVCTDSDRYKILSPKSNWLGTTRGMKTLNTNEYNNISKCILHVQLKYFYHISTMRGYIFNGCGSTLQNVICISLSMPLNA